jgi:hypothetical protein
MLNKMLSKIVPAYKPTPSELLLKDIVEAILLNPDTRVTHAQASEIYYITNSKLEYYIKLTKVSITVSNHTYTFREGLNENFNKALFKIIELFVEAEISKFETEVFKNQTDLLLRIKEHLTQ